MKGIHKKLGKKRWKARANYMRETRNEDRNKPHKGDAHQETQSSQHPRTSLDVSSPSPQNSGGRRGEPRGWRAPR